MKTDYVILLSESSKTDFAKRDFGEQSQEQKVFTAVFGSSGSIFMDGIYCYFLHSNNDSAYFAPEAYKIIGAPKSAEILERASRLLSAEPLPKAPEAVEALALAIPKAEIPKFDALTDEFNVTGEKVTDLLFDYVKLHPEFFGPVPEVLD